MLGGAVAFVLCLGFGSPAGEGAPDDSVQAPVAQERVNVAVPERPAEAATETEAGAEAETETEAEAEAQVATGTEAEAEVPAPRVEAEVGEQEPVVLRCRESKSCVRMTRAGAVVGSLGLAGVVTGAVLLSLPDIVIEDEPIYVSSTRPAGLVAVTLSTGVTLTAVLMLVAARRGLRPRTGSARVALEPMGLRF